MPVLRWSGATARYSHCNVPVETGTPPNRRGDRAATFSARPVLKSRRGFHFIITQVAGNLCYDLVTFLFLFQCPSHDPKIERPVSRNEWPMNSNLLSSLRRLVHLIDDGCRFYRHLYPSRKEPAFYRISCRPDIGPCRAIKWNFSSFQYVMRQSACKCGRNPASSIFWKYIHSDLPHLLAISRTGCQPD